MRLVLAGTLLCVFSLCHGQSTFQLGLLPTFNIHKKLKKDYGLNFKLESRQGLESGTFGEGADFNYEYILTDMTVVASKKVAINKSINIGYMMRVREGRLINRAIQQFVFSSKSSGFRMSHRFATDQTFETNQQTKFRLRYKLSTEIALNGLSVDPREFYLKIGNEYLNSFQGKEQEFELRIIPMLGFKIVDTRKIEIGLDYRVRNVFTKVTHHSFYFGLSLYQVI